MSKLTDDLFEPAHTVIYGAAVFTVTWILGRIASGPSDRCNTVLGRYLSDRDFKTGAKCAAANLVMDGRTLFMVLGAIIFAVGVIGLMVGWKSAKQESEGES